MSFKTLNIGNTALIASQIALNTAGHNVSNATTEGYARQRVKLSATLPDVKTYGVLGGGSEVETVQHVVDDFLERQLRETKTMHDYLNTKRENFVSLETVFNELTDNDISSAFDNFWDSVSDFVDNSADISTRRSVIEQAASLSDSIRNVDGKLYDMRRRLDSNIVDTVNRANVLIDEIASLNDQVVATEQGGLNGVTANDLRDRRTVVSKELANLIDASITESDNGQYVVSVKGRMLVYEQNVYHLAVEEKSSDDMLIHEVVFEKDRDTIDLGQSLLGGMVEVRDETIMSYRKEVDTLAGNFMWEFNRQHNQGQGLSGFSSLTTTVQVLDSDAKLNALEYGFTPVEDTYKVQNGNFEVMVRSGTNGQTTAINIEIDLDGSPADEDTTLARSDTPAFRITDAAPLHTLTDFRINVPEASIPAFTGPEGQLYFNITQDVPAIGDYTVDVYRDPAMGAGDLVATGSRTGAAGDVVLTEFGGSGINGAVRFVYGGVDGAVSTQVVTGTSLVEKLQTGLNTKFPGVFNVSLDNQNHVMIKSSSAEYTFAFGNDTSGVLAALGFNNFFTGYDAGSMNINASLDENPDRLAAASNFVSGNNDNAVALLQMREAKVFSNDSATVDDYYQGIIGRLGIESSNAEHMLATQKDLLTRTENQREELSGVNLDEELTLMIQYQRAFQSAAKFINTANTLYEALINM